MEVVLEKKTFADLRFVRIAGKPDIVDMLFRQIPRELFDQVKDIEFNIDLLYQMPSKFIGGANNMFYVLVDDEDKIKGVLWFSINILMQMIQVQILSIDKEYQRENLLKSSDALKETVQFIREWMNGNDDYKIIGLTTRPRACRKNGWKLSKHVLLEISDGIR
ncbi:hypothetical protein LCGC14_2004650 [marine sediment metagenome]|uniref:N-acetyltransferase domain-containing protein n=1 Tax=marine sediment metagenome TaxID=412755 RepID=A0A0F9FPT3_9ZZZZ